MKKIITLLFSLGIFSISFAQYNRSKDYWNDNYVYNQRNLYGRDDFNPAKQRDYQIQKINNDFQYQVQAIENDRYMSRREKRHAIRNAEAERSKQVQMLDARFDNYRKDYGQHDNYRQNNQRNW